MSATISLTLPDGAKREYPRGTTGMQVAASIAPSLAKAALACSIDGKLSDLSQPIETDSAFAIHTIRDESQALELIRHDCAHIMARAVQEIWPDVKVTIGPVIENGWYYDFDRAEPFSSDDLERIEKKMREIINLRDEVRTEIWPRDKAITFYKAQNEPYKVELVHAIPADQPLRMYWHGPWQDLCRGPHLVHTGQVPGDCFKLTSVAGAYWRGDSRNKMLQRIYGVAFRTRDDLKAYLHMVEEAQKRDHRKLGREMDLFHLQEEAMGSVFWHPKGFVIYNQLEAYIRRRLNKSGYVEVKTPQLMAAKFWEASGHWGKYRENMFVVPDEVPGTDAEGPVISGKADFMALKPMNCPAHIQIFKQGIKSYRDLPLRMAEFGCCHRNEPHGALHGLMRVRQMTQDDAHIFCREDQIQSETEAFCALLDAVYTDFGFTDVRILLATRPEQRAGSDETWDRAEAALGDALRATGRDFAIAPDDGAFYGPKLEFHLKDAIGRSWQLGTLQLDFVLPERLDAAYIAEDGSRQRPVMLHRAILGSLERFIGVLIENYAGKLPLWLAPVQVVVAAIVSGADTYVNEVVAALRAQGIRAEADIRNEKINYKVREHSVAKVPLIFAVGMNEVADRTVSIRRLGESQSEVVELDAALAAIAGQATPPDLIA